jgi:hypothetical protein
MHNFSTTLNTENLNYLFPNYKFFIQAGNRKIFQGETYFWFWLHLRYLEAFYSSLALCLLKLEVISLCTGLPPTSPNLETKIKKSGHQEAHGIFSVW